MNEPLIDRRAEAGGALRRRFFDSGPPVRREPRRRGALPRSLAFAPAASLLAVAAALLGRG